jgi:hypothetical protein
MEFPSTKGFARKLMLFVLVDVVIAIVEVEWEKRAALTDVVILSLFRLPYSLILAALWNALDKR